MVPSAVSTVNRRAGGTSVTGQIGKPSVFHVDGRDGIFTFDSSKCSVIIAVYEETHRKRMDRIFGCKVEV